MNNVLSPIRENIINLFMNQFVRINYEKNNYLEVFRCNRYITEFEEKNLRLFLKSLDKKYPLILDLGCGTGEPYDRYLVENQCDLTGVDFCDKHISLAQEHFGGASAKFIKGDFTKIDFPEPTYDGIVFFYSLYHLPRNKHLDMLMKAKAYLSYGGSILLTIRQEDSGNIKYRDNFCGHPMVWSHYDYSTFKSIVRRAGLSITNSQIERHPNNKDTHLWITLKHSKKKMKS